MRFLFLSLTLFLLLLNSTALAFIITKPDSVKNNTYYFVTNRNTTDSTYAMYKARTNNSGISSVIMRGNFEIIGYPHMRKAEISVYNLSTDELVGIYNTNPKTGNYLVILIPNVKYEFVVNSYGYAPIKKTVEIPVYASTNVNDEISKQKLTLSVDSGVVNLSINSWFVEEKEPTLFLLTVYNPNDFTKSKLELYEINEEDKEIERRQLTETDFGNIDELLKKEAEIESKKPEMAEKAFLKKEYKTALQLYSQLLDLDANDPLNNYRKGISLFHLEKNKLKAIPYLLKAEGKENIPYDIYYYLGVIYHLWADFAKAENSFQKFSTKATASEIENLEINRLIQNCMNGKSLIQEQFDLFIHDKTPIDISKLDKLLPTQLIGDKFFEKSTFFISPIDSKKKEKLWMFKTEQNEMIQTSYGLEDKNKKDLYVNILIGGEKWGIPKSLGEQINTPFDEDFAYVTLDGKTMYFASKGHNSIGGYDIFVSTRKSVTDPWESPKNLGYPINTPYDDMMFMPSLNEKEAYFISNRRSSTEGFNLYRVDMPKPPKPLTILKGQFTTADSIPNYSASIAVYNTNNGEIVGIYNTNANTGNFLMALMPGVKYEYSITADGYKEHTAYVTVPIQTDDFPLRQNIKLKKESAFEILNIDNYFTKEEAEKAPAFAVVKKVDEAVKEPSPVLKEKIQKLNSEQQKIVASAEQFFTNKQYMKCAQQFEKIATTIDLTDKQRYMYGKSLFTTSREYEKIIHHLEIAALNNTIPYDVFYMLGKANHNSYRFERASKSFEKYKSLAKPEEITLHQIDNEIELSRFGKKIINNPKPIEIIQRKHFIPSNFHTIYASLDLPSKFLLTPDDITTDLDKKEKFKPVMFLNETKSVMYFASFGQNPQNGKDIYCMKKLPNNTWSEPVNIGSNINTTSDEDFPFLSKDENTLYFSSKSHGSMGGYDIFKSKWDDASGTWSAPVNLGAPINSPFDDFFYVEE